MDIENCRDFKTLVRANTCFRDLICLDIDKSIICKTKAIAETHLYECLNKNYICGYQICFGSLLHLCTCPIRKHIADHYLLKEHEVGMLNTEV